MEKHKKIKLQKAIIKIDRPYPGDDMIVTYKDVIKYRHVLPFYRFNQAVFENLIKICIENWKSEKRISRLNLLLLIRQSYSNSFGIDSWLLTKMNHHTINIHHSIETRIEIFKLFQHAISESKYLSNKQLEEAQKICNRLIMNMTFSTEEEQWLCDHVGLSIKILNRILRYPIISDTLSNWAKDNYFNDDFRERRIELTSRVLDQNPYFEIDPQTLIDDFEFLNAKDVLDIKKYHEDMFFYKTEQLSVFLKGSYPFSPNMNEISVEEIIDQYFPKIKLTRRRYDLPYIKSELYPFEIPDFKGMMYTFYDDLPIFHMKTMIEAISFSRIDANLKGELLKKYYHPATFELLLSRCKMQKISGTLHWIEKKIR